MVPADFWKKVPNMLPRATKLPRGSRDENLNKMVKCQPILKILTPIIMLTNLVLKIYGIIKLV